MRMRITKLVEVVVDVPERCPHCGVSFTDSRQPLLREVNVEQTKRFVGSAFSDGDEFHVDVEDVDQTVHPAAELHVVGYECDACDAVIAGDVEEPEQAVSSGALHS